MSRKVLQSLAQRELRPRSAKWVRLLLFALLTSLNALWAQAYADVNLSGSVAFSGQVFNPNGAGNMSGLRSYVTQTVSLPEPGNYTFTNTALSPAFDSYMLVYTDFDPANPTQNLIGYNDDGAGNARPKFSAPLQGGREYTFVIMPFHSDTAVSGTVDWSVQGTSLALAAYPRDFAAIAGYDASIVTQWLLEPNGKYWVMCSTTNSFTPPVNGSIPASDSNCSDGAGHVQVSGNAYRWFGLTAGQQYYFSVFPSIPAAEGATFRTDGSAPTADAFAMNVPPLTTAVSTVFEDGRTFIVDAADLGVDGNGRDALGGVSGCTLESGEHVYVTQSISVSESGVYEFENTALRNASTYDTFLALYSSFDPENPTLNLIGCNDDLVFGKEWLPVFSSGLAAGTYTLVLTTWKSSTTLYGIADWEMRGAYQASMVQRPEPDSQPTNVSASAGSTTATVSWDDAVGAVVPDAYLVMCSTADNFTDPVDDSLFIARDADCSDGSGAVYIASSRETYQWIDLMENTQYFFRVYPYTNNGSIADYKTDGVITVSATTTIAGVISTDVTQQN